MSHNYGLTSHDLEECKKKLARQKDYLESHSFFSDDETGEVKTLLDYSYSANLSSRYYARILNKVHTFVSFNVSRGYTPVFLTVTLDGFFRDLLEGDYTRLTPAVIDKYEKHIPNDDRNGKYWDIIRNGSYSDINTKKSYGTKLTSKALYKVLSHQMFRFIRSSTLQRLRRNGEDYSMIRVTEPHKDGVPHFHILMYLPDHAIPSVFHEFKKFFPAPRNHKVKKGGSIIFDKQKETYGFQINIRSAGGYILKYILKSFRNLIEGKDLDYLQAWYVHNKIPRIISTHTLISQDVYHHLSLLDNDWFYMTTIKHNDYCNIDHAMNKYHLISDSNRELIYEDGLYKLINNGVVVNEFGVHRMRSYKFFSHRPYRAMPYKFIYNRLRPNAVDTKVVKWSVSLYPIICNEPYNSSLIHKVNLVDWRLVPKRKSRYSFDYVSSLVEVELPLSANMYYDPVSHDYLKRRDFCNISDIDTSIRLPGYVGKNRLSNLELLEWYYDYDFDLYGVKRFAHLKRILIDKGLLDYEDVDFDDYNTDFDWLREADLNHRLQGYEPCELPSCSIPRYEDADYSLNKYIQT